MIRRDVLVWSTAWLTAAAMSTSSFADMPQVIANTSNLIPDSVNTVQLFVRSNEWISAEDLKFCINDGSSGPLIGSVDILSGTIFASNNAGQFTMGTSRAVVATTTTDRNAPQGTVAADGLLATLQIDARGITTASPYAFQLHLADPQGDPSDFVLPNDELILLSYAHNRFSIGCPDRTWNVNGGGTWNDDGHWNAFAPYAAGDCVKFLGAVTAVHPVAQISLDGECTAGSVTFDNANASYVLLPGNGGRLRLDNGLAAPTISVLGGSHTISAPISLARSTNIGVSAGGLLTVMGSIGGAGADVLINGTATFAGANSYAGTHIAADGVLRIGAGGASGTFGTGPVMNDGLVVVDRSDNVSVGNAISGSGALTWLGPTLTLTGGASYAGITTIAGGRVIFGGSQGNAVGAIGGAGGAGVLEVAANLTSGAVTTAGWEIDVAKTHNLRANGGTSVVHSLVLAGAANGWTAKLDVANNAILILNGDAAGKAAAMARIQNQINYYAGHGTGITSAAITSINSNLTRLVVVDNADLKLTSFRGITAGVNSNALMVGAAHVGDTNLDGLVNSPDFTSMAANWNKLAGATWGQGDFTGLTGVPDGKVTSPDFTTMAAYWNQNVAVAVLPGMGSGPSGGAVPEPGSLGLLLLGGAGWAVRRRGRRVGRST